MGYRELHVIEVKEVLRLSKAGHGVRAVARRTGIDRKTVRRYLEAAKSETERAEEGEGVSDELLAHVACAVRPGGSRAMGQSREECRKHRELIEGWLNEGCRGPKIVKLLARQNVQVPLRTLQRYVAEELGEADRGTVRVVDGKPGELEVDFLVLGYFTDMEGRRVKMRALLCTAALSRHQFFWPCLRETQEDYFDGLEAAWKFFGGVFPVVVSDNPKAVVDVADPVAPKLNVGFVEYMQSRNFEVDAARVRTPTDKARVERQVQFVRNDYFKGERFRGVEDARVEAVRWCREDAGMRTHGRTRQAPKEAFETQELPFLRPPPQEPYDQPRWTTHKVGRDHAVVVGYALYSVPFHYGKIPKLRVRSDRATVKLYLGRELIKVHPRQPKGGTQLDPADMPPEKAALAMRDGTSLCDQAAASGVHVGEYARRLLDSPARWSQMRHAYRLLDLVKRHGADAVDLACAAALALDVVEVIRIDRMLAKNLAGRPPPVPSARQSSTTTALRFARDPAEFRTEVLHASA